MKFAKYTFRGYKMLYKDDIMRLLVRLLAELPFWVPYLLVAAGSLLWVPWRKLSNTVSGGHS